MAVCQPEPFNVCKDPPVYSCQARLVNSTEPSGNAHTTIAGIVSISICRSSGSLVWAGDCVSAVMFCRRYSDMLCFLLRSTGCPAERHGKLREGELQIRRLAQDVQKLY